MKFLIEYDASYKVARGTFYGAVDDDLLGASYKRMGKAARAHKPEMAILDFSYVSRFLVSVGMISRMAVSRPNVADPYPRCVVAPDDVAYGMSRMFQALSEEKRRNFHVVRSISEAYEVLGLAVEPDFKTFDTFELPDPPFSKSRATHF
jgi:hypothetical protein